MTHQPKGGMCAVCTHAPRKCNHLPFHQMQPIKRDGDAVIVRCNEFERASVMSRFIIVIHGWHVSSNGFDVIELEAPSKDAAEEKAAWLTQQREQAFDKCAYKVIELQQGEHVARPLTWRERITGRIT